MFELLFIVFVIWIAVISYNEHVNSTKLESEKQKFNKISESIKQSGIASRESYLRKAQRDNLEELAVIVREKLNGFKMDIPPRLYQNALDSINTIVDNIEFDRLHELYKILVNTRKNLVFEELNKFFEWGYIQ